MEHVTDNQNDGWNGPFIRVFSRWAPFVALLALFLFSVGREIGGTSAAWAAVAVSNTFLLAVWYEVRRLQMRMRYLEEQLAPGEEDGRG